VLGGDSAGGNLAAGTALLLRETDPALKLRGLLINYGVMDSAMATPSYDAFATGHFLTREKMDFYWRCYAPKEADRVSPFASPMRADLRGLPPVLVHIAELDVLADENKVFAEKLRAAGIAVTEEVFPGTIHGFLRALGHVAAADRAARQGGAWLKARFA
jgi:acetyl esterase